MSSTSPTNGRCAVFETRALRVATPTILRQHKVPSWTSLLEPTPIG